MGSGSSNRRGRSLGGAARLLSFSRHLRLIRCDLGGVLGNRAIQFTLFGLRAATILGAIQAMLGNVIHASVLGRPQMAALAMGGCPFPVAQPRCRVVLRWWDSLGLPTTALRRGLGGNRGLLRLMLGFDRWRRLGYGFRRRTDGRRWQTGRDRLDGGLRVCDLVLGFA